MTPGARGLPTSAAQNVFPVRKATRFKGVRFARKLIELGDVVVTVDCGALRVFDHVDIARACDADGAVLDMDAACRPWLTPGQDITVTVGRPMGVPPPRNSADVSIDFNAHLLVSEME